MFYPCSGELEKLRRLGRDQPDESVGDRSDVGRHEPGTRLFPAVTVDQKIRVNDAPKLHRDRDQSGDKPAIEIPIDVTTRGDRRDPLPGRPPTGWAKPTLKKAGEPDVAPCRGSCRVDCQSSFTPTFPQPDLPLHLVQQIPGDLVGSLLVEHGAELLLGPLADLGAVVRDAIVVGSAPEGRYAGKLGDLTHGGEGKSIKCFDDHALAYRIHDVIEHRSGTVPIIVLGVAVLAVVLLGAGTLASIVNPSHAVEGVGDARSPGPWAIHRPSGLPRAPA